LLIPTNKELTFKEIDIDSRIADVSFSVSGLFMYVASEKEVRCFSINFATGIESQTGISIWKYLGDPCSGETLSELIFISHHQAHLDDPHMTTPLLARRLTGIFGVHACESPLGNVVIVSQYKSLLLNSSGAAVAQVVEVIVLL
jgi:hypothetical protein